MTRENYTETQRELFSLLEKLVGYNETTQQYEMTQQSALRDILTDLQHVAEFEELDWPFALQESLEVWNQEQE